jgi:Zn-finger nucleic acid-binding protein
MEKLAGMAYCTVPELMKLAWEQQKEREETRTQLCVSESSPEQLDSAPRHDDSEAERVYNIRSPKGEWMGPFTPAELITQAFFTSSILVHDTANDVRAPAREFLAILATIRGEAGSAGIGNCPNHHGKLKPISYEGVELLECPVCRGRAAKSRADVQKILVRRDVSFSPALVEKAKETQKNLMLNPAKKLAPFGGKALPESLSQQRSCPYCGGSMSQRPYNYQFFIPIDECLRCGGMWFDADELEILQILVEQKGTL